MSDSNTGGGTGGGGGQGGSGGGGQGGSGGKGGGGSARRRGGRPRRRRGRGGNPQGGSDSQPRSGDGNVTSGAKTKEKSADGNVKSGPSSGGGEKRGSERSKSGSSRRRRGRGGQRGKGQERDGAQSQEQRKEDGQKRGGRPGDRGRDSRRDGDKRSQRDRGRQGGRSRGAPKADQDILPFKHEPRKPQPEELFEGSSEDFTSMEHGNIDFLKPHEADEDVLLEDMPERDFGQRGSLMDVAGVKLHASGAITDYDCQDALFEHGEEVIVETGRGLALGQVVITSTRRMIRRDKIHRIIRKASQNDMRQRDRNVAKEKAARDLCQAAIEDFKLNMKLIGVDYLHGGNKAVFYFSAEGRVDFRELVREMARKLHIRIEMRQIGVRDASRMLGGLGSCGLRLCCNRYIREFAPVSIRMAKDQDLVLNPEKVSGLCGRLMCCLSYEDEVYREAARNMPKVGRRVLTPRGEGRLRDRDVLKRVVRVQFPDEPGLHEFSADEVQSPGPQKPREKSGEQKPPRDRDRSRGSAGPESRETETPKPEASKPESPKPTESAESRSAEADEPAEIVEPKEVEATASQNDTESGNGDDA